MKEKGITLIALVITIIVLIILAGVSINVLLGDNGLIIRAQDAEIVQEKADLVTSIQQDIFAEQIDKVPTQEKLTQSDIETILEGYGTVNKNENGTIKSLTPTDKNYEIPFKEIAGDVELREAPTESLEPESGGTEFATTYGVIEVKFMENNTYYTSKTANAPKVDEANGMKLVKFDTATSSWVEGTEYSYVAGTGTADNTSSKWANAKVTKDGVDSYFVWIPRYAYKIIYFDTPAHRDAYRADNTQTTGIVGYSDSRGIVDASGKKIEGIASSTSIDVGDYYMVHPAFTADASIGGGFGELEGLWIGKYESSRSDAKIDGAGSSSTLKVVPSVKTWKSLIIGDMYTAAKDYNPNLKSHMLKNSEWGAVAYLADSRYGRNGNEIAVNQCTGFITGAGPGEGDSNIYNSTYGYDANNFETTYSYTSTQGQKASTTGNVYGIYDVSGGSTEYVASYYNASTYSPSRYETYASSFASSEGTSDEYSTVYTGEEAKSSYIKGDATYETSGWNSDGASFVNSDYPFFTRGWFYYFTSETGVFHFNLTAGNSGFDGSFRTCLVVK